MRHLPAFKAGGGKGVTMWDKSPPTLLFTFAIIHVHMLHIADFPTPFGFLLAAGNLHNIRPYQTTHPWACAKREKVKDFGYGVQPTSPPSRHPTVVPTSTSPHTSICGSILSFFRELTFAVVLIDLARIHLPFQACSPLSHEPSLAPDPPYPSYALEPAPSDSAHSMVFTEPLSPPDPPEPVFALRSFASFVFRLQPSIESSFFPTVCRISHRVLFVHTCLASTTSLIQHCHAPNFIVNHPRACHSALTRPHRTSLSRTLSSPTSVLVLSASVSSATSCMLLSMPSFIVAIVPLLPPSFSSVLCCNGG